MRIPGLVMVGVIGMGGALWARTALATHAEPRRAVSYSTSLAAPPASDDPTCMFRDARSYANLTVRLAFVDPFTLLRDDLEVKGRLIRLSTACAGETLTVTASLVLTLDDCGGSACTLIQLPDYPLAACVVSPNGGCILPATRLSTFVGSLVFDAGKRTGVELRDVKIRRGGLTPFVPTLVAQTRQFHTVRLVTSYADCLLPGGSLTSDPPGLVLPGCAPVPNDPVCGFSSTGQGNVAIKMRKNTVSGMHDDLRLNATLRNLTDGCDGESLSFVVGGVAVASCSVDPSTNGCRIRGLVVPGTTVPQVDRVEVKRGALTTFTSGILIP